MEHIGSRLRMWRKSNGYTQADLGQRTGMGQNTISGVERGRYGLTSDSLARLAKLGFDLHWLVTGAAFGGAPLDTAKFIADGRRETVNTCHAMLKDLARKVGTLR